MELLIVNKNKIKHITNKAVNFLKRGAIIAYATETFYGLGVKFDIEDSIKRLYKLKNRPFDKPLPLIIGNEEQLFTLVDSIDKKVKELIQAFWPGPLTLIFKANNSVPNYITAGTGKVALRIPGNSFALNLAKASRFPITATSANPSGLEPAKCAFDVKKYFNDNVDLIIDSGDIKGLLPSTILDVSETKFRIIREGIIEREKLSKYL